MRTIALLLLSSLACLNNKVVVAKKHLLRHHHHVVQVSHECESDFKELDANGDGTLTRSDLITVLSAAGLAPKAVDTFLGDDVRDGDAMSMAEFCGAEKMKEKKKAAAHHIKKQKKQAQQQKAKLSNTDCRSAWEEECGGTNCGYIAVRTMNTQILLDYGLTSAEIDPVVEEPSDFWYMNNMDWASFSEQFCAEPQAQTQGYTDSYYALSRINNAEDDDDSSSSSSSDDNDKKQARQQKTKLSNTDCRSAWEEECGGTNCGYIAVRTMNTQILLDYGLTSAEIDPVVEEPSDFWYMNNMDWASFSEQFCAEPQAQTQGYTDSYYALSRINNAEDDDDNSSSSSSDNDDD